jgi:hypothetical protein
LRNKRLRIIIAQNEKNFNISVLKSAKVSIFKFLSPLDVLIVTHINLYHYCVKAATVQIIAKSLDVNKDISITTNKNILWDNKHLVYVTNLTKPLCKITVNQPIFFYYWLRFSIAYSRKSEIITHVHTVFTTPTGF